MHSIDILVQAYLSGIHTPILTWLMLVATNTFEVLPVILISILVAILIFYKQGLRYSFLFLASLGVGEVFDFILKTLFNVSRPTGGLIVETGKSFPSGHATAVTVFFIILMYIFSGHMKKKNRIFFNIFSVLMIVYVSFSRLYLGVHWASDVLGGIILGLITVYMSIKIFEVYKYKFDNFVLKLKNKYY